MKQLFAIPALALLLAALPLRAQTPSAQPPQEAVDLLEKAYFPALAANDLPAAIQRTDVRGFRQYLLDRRMAEVRAAHPDMAPQDLDALSAFYQTNNLAPDHLNEILADSLSRFSAAGASLSRVVYSPAPPPFENAFLAQISASAPDGSPRSILVGLKLLGDRWFIAPEIPMDISFRAAAQSRVADLPRDADSILRAFCNACVASAPESAYALFSPDYRARVSLDSFIAAYRSLSSRIGAPSSWSLSATRQLAPNRYGAGVDFVGSRGSSPSIFVFQLLGRAWVLSDVSFTPPPNFSVAPAAPAPARPAPAPFKLNLSPPVSTIPSPASPGDSFFRNSAGKARPDKPIGPDLP